MGALGIALHPLVFIICFLDIALKIITNYVRKQQHKNEWIMQCSRCNHEFIVPNPDRVEFVNAQNAEKQAEREKRDAENREKIRLKEECLKHNGELNSDEVLVGLAEYFGFHKNAFCTTEGKLKVSDKAFIVYNSQGSFRIPKNNVICVKKKNYFMFIFTGIEIRTNDNRKKYYFVVFPQERDQIISLLNK